MLAYGDSVDDNAAGYAPTVKLIDTWKAGRAVRLWRLGSRIISLQLAKRHGWGIWKARERLPLDEPLGQLDALSCAGVEHPSSWGDTYHQKAPNTVRIKHTYNGMLNWWPGGPWSEARKIGTFRGKWYRYDLISAYRWAATLGLPDPTTYRVETQATRLGVLKRGIWLARIKPRDDLPTVFRTDDIVVVTSEDIETYQLDATIERGVTWTDTYPDNYVERTLTRLPFPKEAGRAYWGRWIARDPLICQTATREWPMRNIFANFVWGWLIVHRVRSRVWEQSRNAVHVYVDEVVVPHELPTGKRIGEWNLKQIYEKGVAVDRTGSYGDAGNTLRTMRTGVKR